MNTNEILIAIDAEIVRLQKAKALLTSIGVIQLRKRGRPATANKATSFDPSLFAGKSRKRRKLSPEARERIAAAQRERWAKSKKVSRGAAVASEKKGAAKKSVRPKGSSAKKAAGKKLAKSTAAAALSPTV